MVWTRPGPLSLPIQLRSMSRVRRSASHARSPAGAGSSTVSMTSAAASRGGLRLPSLAVLAMSNVFAVEETFQRLGLAQYDFSRQLTFDRYFHA